MSIQLNSIAIIVVAVSATLYVADSSAKAETLLSAFSDHPSLGSILLAQDTNPSDVLTIDEMVDSVGVP